jgi:predicted DNA-binding protein YlxM (UPF0122 family)
MIRAYLTLSSPRGLLAVGLILMAMAVVPAPVVGQWSGTNPISTSSNVGIGTNTPFSKLHLQASGAAAYLTLSNTVSGKYWYQGFLDDGKFALLYSADLVQFPSRLLIDTNGNVGIGTTAPQYKLAVNGTIGAQDVIVTSTGWSDFVFRPGYHLRPLSEVSQYIKTNGHLPDIPTEAEVKEKGVSVGDMQAKLLAKVEELTLHMIQQDQENRDLRDQMNKRTRENQDLRERLDQLEKVAAADSTPGVGK